MTQSPLQPIRPEPTRPVADGPLPSKDPAGRPDPASPSFQVLLERLQSKARELEETSRTLVKPEELAEAVESARASLEDAGSLSDRLLEAFRAARTQAPQQDLDGRQPKEQK